MKDLIIVVLSLAIIVLSSLLWEYISFYKAFKELQSWERKEKIISALEIKWKNLSKQNILDLKNNIIPSAPTEIVEPKNSNSVSIEWWVENGFRIVPSRPYLFHKLVWRKYGGKYQEELFAITKFNGKKFCSNVGRVQDVINGSKGNGERRYMYSGICDRLGTGASVNESSEPFADNDRDKAKKWVEQNYGIKGDISNEQDLYRDIKNAYNISINRENVITSTGLSVVPEKPNLSNKLLWRKYNGQPLSYYLEELYVIVDTPYGCCCSNVGSVAHDMDGYVGHCDRLGIASDIKSGLKSIEDAKLWVEENYGIRECQNEADGII